MLFEKVIFFERPKKNVFVKIFAQNTSDEIWKKIRAELKLHKDRNVVKNTNEITKKSVKIEMSQNFK